MFDVGPSELLLIVVVAVVVIGPKDLPRALYKIGQVIGKAKGMARHFRTGVDAMIREAELDELQKQWAKENERIMAATAIPELNGPRRDDPELDGVMTPLTDETGQPIDTAAPLPPIDEAATLDEARNNGAAPGEMAGSGMAGDPVGDARAVPDAPASGAATADASSATKDGGRAATMPVQPRLPLDAGQDIGPDDAPGGSSAS